MVFKFNLRPMDSILDQAGFEHAYCHGHARMNSSSSRLLLQTAYTASLSDTALLAYIGNERTPRGRGLSTLSAGYVFGRIKIAEVPVK